MQRIPWFDLRLGFTLENIYLSLNLDKCHLYRITIFASIKVIFA